MARPSSKTNLASEIRNNGKYQISIYFRNNSRIDTSQFESDKDVTVDFSQPNFVVVRDGTKYQYPMSEILCVKSKKIGGN